MSLKPASPAHSDPVEVLPGAAVSDPSVGSGKPTRSRGGFFPAGFGTHLLLSLLLLPVGLLTHMSLLKAPMHLEDIMWIFGFTHADKAHARLGQSFLLRDVARPLFDANYELFFAMSLSVHLLNAALASILLFLILRIIRSPRWGSIPSAHAAGLFAGLLLLSYDDGQINYLSSLSYMLAPTIMMLGLITTLMYLHSRRIWFWLLLAGLHLLGLITSSTMTFGLPFLVLFLEILWRQGRSEPLRPLELVCRYLPLFWMLDYFISTYYSNPLKMTRFHLLSLKMLYVQALHYAHYLLLTWTHFLHGKASFSSFSQEPIYVYQAVLAVALLLGAWGLWQALAPGRRPGLAAGLTLFVVLWFALILLQILAAGSYIGSWWRYYYTITGLCLAGGLMVGATLHWLSTHLPRVPGVLVGLLGIILFANLPLEQNPLTTAWDRLRDLPQIHNRWYRNPNSWDPPAWCKGGLRPADEAAIRLADRPHDLRCLNLRAADLQDLDLSGVNLSGSLLVHANFSGSSLRGARLRGACLAWSTLNRTDLRRADLAGADLTGARQDRTNFTDANLKGALLQGFPWQGFIWDGLSQREAASKIQAVMRPSSIGMGR